MNAIVPPGAATPRSGERKQMTRTEPISQAWAEDLATRIDGLRGLATPTSNKYDAVKAYLGEELETQPAVCYLSDLGKQWVARVGQAVMGCPGLLILLVHGQVVDEVAERLARLHAYMSGLEGTLVCFGEEGRWRVSLVAGRTGVPLYEALVNAFPNAAQRDVTVRGNTKQPRGSKREAIGTSVSFLEMAPDAQADLIWQSLIGAGELDSEEAVRIAAEDLRDEGFLDFERLRSDGRVVAAINGAISYSTRRSMLFDRPHRNTVRAIEPNAAEYSRDDWRNCVRNVMEIGVWMERDDVVRQAAHYAIDVYGLDMMRLRRGGVVDRGLRSAINGLIRVGLLTRDGPERLRREKAPAPSTLPPYDEGLEAPVEVPQASSVPGVLEESRAAVESELDPTKLRNRLGPIPPECESRVLALLAAPVAPPEKLRQRTEAHLRAFEDVFEYREFLDMAGAERLASDCAELLDRWVTLSEGDRRLAQAAIEYFVLSDDADDDFGIGGLRTDKAVMAAVREAIGVASAAPERL